MDSEVWTQVLTDEAVRSPLWEWPVADRLPLLRERRRRFGAPSDEEVGDIEYS